MTTTPTESRADAPRRENLPDARWRIDRVGGYPFGVAGLEEVFRFCRDCGFALLELTTCGGGLGWNQFVFRRGTAGADRTG